MGNIGEMISPFLFPLKIEYSVVAATMVLGIWEKCGLGQDESSHKHHLSPGNDSHTAAVMHRRLSMQSTGSSGGLSNHGYDNKGQSHSSKYYNNHVGFIIGYVVICVSVAVIIIYLFMINEDDINLQFLESAVYSFDMLIKAFCLVTIIFTMYKMSVLTTKDLEIKKLRGLREHRHLKMGKVFTGVWTRIC